MRVRQIPGHEGGALSWPPGAARSAAAALRDFARRYAVQAPVAVAFSGGADSTALLLAALQLWGVQGVRALHVDHGLQSAAAAFRTHVRDQCAAWQVPLLELSAQVRRQRGESLEEQAREARYRLLSGAAREAGCAWLLLGHQADDQAESLLLALLRGAGPKGLAAMPEVTSRAGPNASVNLGRPLLAVPAPVLRAELESAGVAYVSDPMNADPAFRRSRIRHELLPALQALEPAWRRTLARSARLCAQAAALQQEQAQLDLAACSGEHGLRLPALRALPRARLAEVLRAWLGQAGVRSNAGHIDELCRQVECSATGAARLDWRLGATRVWRRGAWLCLRSG